MEKQITFTTQEANALIQLLDIAVKTQGMQAAEAALHLTKKVQEAFKEEGEEVEVEEKEDK